MYSGPYLGFFVCGGKLGFREISDQYSYKKQPSKIRHYVRKKTFSFPGGGNCPLRPPAMYGPGINKYFALTWSFYVTSFLGIGDSSQGFANFFLFCSLTDHIRKKFRLCCVRLTPWYHEKEKDPPFESKKFPLNKTSDFSSNSYGAGDCICVYSMNYTA